MPDVMMDIPALSMQGMTKNFGGVRALDGASITVRRGSIHGLIGQNGAGKSTIIKILAGMIQADSGTIEINGKQEAHTSPRALERMGIFIIHQDRLLVPTFTVGEALFLGNEPRTWGVPLLNRREMERRAAVLLREYFEIELPLGCLIAELTTAQQKIVQITRALLQNPTILVLDEPTAALVKREVDLLFVALRRMRERGISLIYISHYLEEIEALCDEVTVLRNGRSVGILDPRIARREDVITMMVARNIDDLFPKHTVTPGEVVLRVSGLTRRKEYEDVSFDVRRGEILGITGLVGSGTKELFRTLFGLQKASSGTIEVHGEKARLNSPLDAIRRRMAMVPEDRRAHGVATTMTIQENVTLASLRKFGRFGFLRKTKEREAVEALITKLGIVTSGPNALIGELSGGNQQKVAVAKWLSRESSIYLLDEPTVAVDVGAKVDIYNLMHELTAKGAAIVMLSTDLVELTGVCDRMLVMYRGRIVKEYHPGATSDEILRCATGA
jgi:ribose transport system ATP-binding protein